MNTFIGPPIRFGFRLSLLRGAHHLRFPPLSFRAAQLHSTTRADHGGIASSTLPEAATERQGSDASTSEETDASRQLQRRRPPRNDGLYFDKRRDTRASYVALIIPAAIVYVVVEASPIADVSARQLGCRCSVSGIRSTNPAGLRRPHIILNPFILQPLPTPSTPLFRYGKLMPRLPTGAGCPACATPLIRPEKALLHLRQCCPDLLDSTGEPGLAAARLLAAAALPEAGPGAGSDAAAALAGLFDLEEGNRRTAIRLSFFERDVEGRPIKRTPQEVAELMGLPLVREFVVLGLLVDPYKHLSD